MFKDKKWEKSLWNFRIQEKKKVKASRGGQRGRMEGGKEREKEHTDKDLKNDVAIHISKMESGQ